MNSTYFNNFERVQRKLIIKRDDKNDIRKTLENTHNKRDLNNFQINNNNNNKMDDIENINNKKFKDKKINSNFNKSPIDEDDKFPKNNNYTLK